ncbi:MAG: response regulator transcription factor [Clostridia bacterium]|nr:response regulator transcription factor [Clostridia bacterium]
MIFCVEDDTAIRELMLYTLNSTGYETMGLPDGQAFWKALALRRPELVLLDIMLPGENGISILKKLRSSSATADIPVILATAKSTEYDKVIGLDMGADDYLTKPFGMMEMVSRVKAVLRRAAPKNDNTMLRIGELKMNTGEHTVWAAGERVQLTLKEYELLLTFLQSPRRVFTRDQLLSMIWGADFVGETRTVDVHIGTLRTKLGACGTYIETVRGVGYRLEEKA